MNLLPHHIKLLPPHPVEGLYIILFVDRADQAAERTWDHAVSLDWPPGTILHALVAAEAREITSWFGIKRFPALAAISDGALLALEQGCEDGCASRLLACANHAAAFIDCL
jgi:hypothetical protein